MAKPSSKQITTSSTAEYFSKNLQQVGFSSQTKAVLTTLKEAVDNALDACEEHGILPEVEVWIKKVGAGSLKNSDQISITVLDNGPGIEADDVPKVFGEYLASSKFGRGRCSRGQQGIGISAATTWAQLTTATGARVISKTKTMRKALSALVEVDIKHNKGSLRSREMIDWKHPLGTAHGTQVEFQIDGRVQLNGEAGLISYLTGTTLVNPHLTLHYTLPASGDEKPQRITIARVSQELPEIPEAVEPHPHTMKLGEFIAHSHLFGRTSVGSWLKKGFSRVNEGTIKDLIKGGEGVTPIKKGVFEASVDALDEGKFKELFTSIQNLKLMAPSTRSVLSIGEDAMAKSIRRLGEIDFFSVVSRKPTICDFKPVQVEVAVARLQDRATAEGGESPVQVLRFANRVPLQFDKSACAIVGAIESVNWRSYGIAQPKDSIPLGPYIIAVSVVSPFIKFKNASKETIDGSDELVTEIRLALIQAGQKLSRHIRAEAKADELEEKIRHIEQFGPILVQGLVNISGASAARKAKAEAGLMKILGRDAKESEAAATLAAEALEKQKSRQAAKRGEDPGSEGGADIIDVHAIAEGEVKKPGKTVKASKKTKASSKAKTREAQEADV